MPVSPVEMLRNLITDSSSSRTNLSAADFALYEKNWEFVTGAVRAQILLAEHERAQKLSADQAQPSPITIAPPAEMDKENIPAAVIAKQAAVTSATAKPVRFGAGYANLGAGPKPGTAAHARMQEALAAKGPAQATQEQLEKAEELLKDRPPTSNKPTGG